MFGLNEAGRKQFSTVVACSTISGFAVLVRLFCKAWYKQGFHSDDYWIVIGLIFYWVSSAFALWGRITGGGGLEMEQLLIVAKNDPTKVKQLENYIQSQFLTFIFFLVAVLAVKISILYFYRRIFFVTETYRYTSFVLIILSIATCIGTEIGVLIICQPVDKFWRPMKPGKCRNSNPFFLATGIVDIVMDAVILVLPVRIALALRLPIRTKVALAGIFGLGGFAVITNIMRITHVYQSGTKYVKFAQTERWSNIHLLSAFVCACLPIYKLLWNTISNFTANWISRSSLLRSSFGAGKPKFDSTSYVRMGNVTRTGDSHNSERKDLATGQVQSNDHIRSHSTANVISGERDDRELLQVPPGRIAYSRNVTVV